MGILKIAKMVVLSASIVLTGLVFTACGEKSVDLMQFAAVNFSGIDSKGNAEVKVDWSDFETQLSEVLGDSLSDSGKIMRLEDTIKYEVDVKENLTNGDKVKLSVTWDKDAAKKSGFSFTGKEIEIDTSGLAKATIVDLFKDVVIDYEGASPRATANIRNTSSDEFLKSVTYSIGRYTVANGDVLTLTANYNKKQAEEKGYLIESDKKEYTVAGIDEYVSKYSQIDKATLDEMDEQAKTVIKAGMTNEMIATMYLHKRATSFVKISELKFDDIKLVDNYFFTLKNGVEKSYSNSDSYIYMLYELSFSDNITPDGSVAYMAVFYNNIILRNDGVLEVNVTNAEINEYSTDFDDIYRDVVTANKVKYDCEEISISARK